MKKLLITSLLACSLATVNAGEIPAECQKYMDMVETLAKKSPQSAAAFKQSLEASKASWAKLTDAQAAQVGASCKQMAEQLKPMIQ